ncbi:hypothetical protein KA005_40245 [bacterium]|nr:hypothetical protein [bacterium]
MTFNFFVTVAEIGADLGVTRQRVHQIIKTFDLNYKKIGSMLLIDKASYNKYCKLRLRRDLAGMAGRTETKFIHTAIHDTVCKSCGAFAVNWEGTIACEKGHTVKE